MVLSNYLSTTVFRYYIRQFINSLSVFTKRSAIQIKDNFYNPRAGIIVQFKNPRAGITIAFEPLSEVA